MTVTAKALVEMTAVLATDTTLYTAPTSTRAIVDKMTATNTTAAALTLTINLVPAAGAVAVGNASLQAQSIAPGTTYLCPEVVGHILNAGDYISVKGSAVGIAVRVSGREVN